MARLPYIFPLHPRWDWIFHHARSGEAFRESSREAQEPVTGARARRMEKRRKGRKEPERKGSRSLNSSLGEVPRWLGFKSEKEPRREKEEDRQGGRSVAPEGYVWVLSRHIPFYHASGLRCPRSRCQENGRIFPLRAQRHGRDSLSHRTRQRKRGQIEGER